MVAKRKKRSDRNYILYVLENKHTGSTYIGLSAVIGSAKVRTLKVRFKRHVSKAFTEAKSWTLHKALRKHPMECDWNRTILQVIRGRKAAYQLERQLIAEHQPDLNTF
jgi:hypothetical protein